MNLFKILICILIGYFIGSIPFSFLIAKWVKGIDLRKFGDGNVGASNVSRAVSRKAGVAAFFCDVLKGVFPVFLSQWILKFPDYAVVLSGLSTITGHNWPIFLKFKGGKGLSTTIGVMGTLVPIEGAILLIPLFFVYKFLKHGIFSVIIVGSFLPFICWFRNRSIWLIWGTAFILLFVYIGGFGNVRRAWMEIRTRLRQNLVARK